MKSKMTETTQNVILVIEGLPPVTLDKMQVVLGELAGLVSKYCGGMAENVLLNADNNIINI